MAKVTIRYWAAAKEAAEEGFRVVAVELASGIVPNASGDRLHMGMILKKDNLKLAEALKAALNAVIADGTYAKIIQQWHYSDQSKLSEASLN